MLVGHTRLIDDDGRTETAQVSLVFGMVAHIGMIARQHKDGILKPWFLTGLLKELAYRHIRIADALMHLQSLFGINFLVFLGNLEGMMTAGSKHGSHKGLLHFRHLGSIVLQERLIPDGPHTIKVLIAIKALVGIKVFSAIIILKTRATRKGLKAHRATLCTMEECRLITFCCQQRCDTIHMVH